MEIASRSGIQSGVVLLMLKLLCRSMVYFVLLRMCDDKISLRLIPVNTLLDSFCLHFEFQLLIPKKFRT